MIESEKTAKLCPEYGNERANCHCGHIYLAISRAPRIDRGYLQRNSGGGLAKLAAILSTKTADSAYCVVLIAEFCEFAAKFSRAAGENSAVFARIFALFLRAIQAYSRRDFSENEELFQTRNGRFPRLG